MTIASINAYSDGHLGDPRLNRTWVRKEDYEQLEEKVRILQERIANMEREFTYFMKLEQN
ncbi:MAG: hypothetical protein CMM29_07380 [Rhodospirillaceae bacterium]|nr:hypothetical protein [Rhodospirillaceae bacterium]